MSKARELAELGNAYSDGALSNRNLIINGAMQVAQRGTSFTNPTANQYMIDRWFMGGSPTNLTVTQQSNVTVNGTISKTMRLDASGVSNFDVYQAIEDWEYLSNKTVTMSFWYRTNVDGIVLRQYATATHDTLPSTSGAWQYRSVSFTLGTLQSTPRAANCATFGFWDNSTGNFVSGSYFEVTQIQLEVGDTATPFEHRSYGQELALCQRYYQTDSLFQDWFGAGITCSGAKTTGDLTTFYQFPMIMRSTPSLAVYDYNLLSGKCSRLDPGVAWYNNSAVSTGGINPRGFYIVSSSGSNASGAFVHWQADAEL